MHIKVYKYSASRHRLNEHQLVGRSVANTCSNCNLNAKHLNAHLNLADLNCGFHLIIANMSGC